MGPIGSGEAKKVQSLRNDAERFLWYSADR